MIYVTNAAGGVWPRGRFRMDGAGGFRAHHKYLIAAIGVIAVLAFLYNLGVFDIWSVSQTAK
jgi:hypothetical protein